MRLRSFPISTLRMSRRSAGTPRRPLPSRCHPLKQAGGLHWLHPPLAILPGTFQRGYRWQIVAVS